MTPALTLLEEKDRETRNLMPHYIPPRRTDAPRITVLEKKAAPLIVPLVPKGVKVLKDIIPNLRKLSFDDHDMRIQTDLDHQNYIDTVYDTVKAPKRFVANEWTRGLEQCGILSMLYMPHFGYNTPINTYVNCYWYFSMVESYGWKSYTCRY